MQLFDRPMVTLPGGKPDATPYLPPADRGLIIVAEDEFLIVAAKPAGLLSVPGRGEGKADCLVARVQAVYPEALIVHRLDLGTSGLLVFGRGAEMHSKLSKAFMERRVDKGYVAIVAGQAPEVGLIDMPLITDWPNRPRQMVHAEWGKPSRTEFRRLAYDPTSDTSRVALTPITGRSHQLRVHLAAIGHPILGDDLYGPAHLHRASRLLLHAADLAFEHPVSGKPCAFHIPPEF